MDLIVVNRNIKWQTERAETQSWVTSYFRLFCDFYVTGELWRMLAHQPPLAWAESGRTGPEDEEPGWADTWRADHWGGRHVGHVYCAGLVTQSCSSEPHDKFSVSWGVIAEQRSRDIKVKCSVWSSHMSTQSQPQPSPNWPFQWKKQKLLTAFSLLVGQWFILSNLVSNSICMELISIILASGILYRKLINSNSYLGPTHNT